ncbi:MAG: family 43 glycosylhydrolase [Clostridiales bacterium]|nr:family 43 glycosylhydrolase [Clostridiales bacterium]
MKKRLFALLLVCLLFAVFTGCGGGSAAKLTFTNPIADTGNDPWVTLHEGKYYYCYASGGVQVAAFDNLPAIGQAAGSLVWKPPAGTAYSKELWAPELHYLDGAWYIYVAADDGDNANHRMYVLKGASQDPTQPFELVGKIAPPEDFWAIDGTVLEYKERLYFVWSGWEDTENLWQDLYIAPMSDPCTISGSRVRISTPEYPWERVGNPMVNEGPAALTRGGVLHIVYSASGSWTDDYCLGLLTLTGDDPLDPKAWEKAPKPILSKSETVFGPGHCSFTTSPDGKETFIVYHANTESGTGWGGRKVFAQKVEWDKEKKPVLGEPAGPDVKMEIGANGK